MRSIVSNRSVAVGALFATATFALADACKPGGEEGDACNPLVLRSTESCNAGLTCKAATCSASHCCPADRSSTEPNCNGAGCPNEDGGDEGGAAAEGDPGSTIDASSDAGLDAAAQDAGDGG